MMTNADRLQDWIAQTGGNRIGQVFFWMDNGVYKIRHVDDEFVPEDSLTLYTKPHDAIEIAKFNAEGEYRPLKTSPDLMTGWLLKVTGISQLLAALDFLYPAMVGTYFALQEKRAEPLSMRANLNRQTGMYRYARTIEDDDAQVLVGELCSAENCLKRVMWDLDDDGTEIASLPEEEKTAEAPKGELPLLCLEPCCLLVAAARVKAKEAFAAKNAE